MRRKYWTRRDVNHAEIRDGLRKLGAVVFDTADLGGRALDLAVCWRGRVVFAEVKNSEVRWEVSEKQRESIEALHAVGVEAIVAISIEDVVEAFGTLKTA